MEEIFDGNQGHCQQKLQIVLQDPRGSNQHRLWKEMVETEQLFTAGYKTLVPNEYLARHELVAGIIHQKLNIFEK